MSTNRRDTDRQRLPRRRPRRWFAAGLVGLTLTALVAGLSATAQEAEPRRALGERFARAFSDEAKVVTWDDAACTFVETTRDAAEGKPQPTQSVIVPVGSVSQTTLKGRRARTLDVTFRCGEPTKHCIARIQRFGSIVTRTERIDDHTMTLAGSIAETPKLKADLGRLHRACAPAKSDAGASD